ncbi:MAG TPA: prepilin peptidase [Gemmatimonadota bacterium]|jgi:prepilin peptidase CpaA|nr:prepilin peptidase [Gemmatimonadota bacterium]
MTANLALVGLAAVVLVAVVWDVRERRIPNALTVAGLVLAIALRSLEGPEALLVGLAGLVLAVVIALPLVALGGLGGGDAKLLAAVGAFLGPMQLLIALAITALAGGVMAVVLAIHRGALHESMVGAGVLVMNLFGRGIERPRRTIRSPGALTIPYAVPIAIGALAVWLL